MGVQRAHHTPSQRGQRPQRAPRATRHLPASRPRPPSAIRPSVRTFLPAIAISNRPLQHLRLQGTSAPASRPLTRRRCPAEHLGLRPPGGGGERATSGGWSRALPITVWGAHLGRRPARGHLTPSREFLGLFRCLLRTNFGGCPSSHNSNKHGGWGRGLSLHLGPCGGDNPSPLAARPFSDLGSNDGGCYDNREYFVVATLITTL